MIVLIDNYDSFTYNLYQMLAKTVSTEVFRNDSLTVEDIITLNPKGIVISPGPKAPKDAGICLELIEKLHTRVPIFGVCLGFQAIAECFGGKVIRSKDVIHGRAASVFHSRQDLFEKMPLPFQAARYHSLIVEKSSLPKVLTISAEAEDGTIMGIKHHEFPLYGVQFHPESILTPDGHILIESFLNICGV